MTETFKSTGSIPISGSGLWSGTRLTSSAPSTARAGLTRSAPATVQAPPPAFARQGFSPAPADPKKVAGEKLG